MTRTALALLVAGSASAQDARFFAQATTLRNVYIVYAQFLEPLPAGTSFDAVWLDINILITGNGRITFNGWNPSLRTDAFGDPVITGQGTTSAHFSGKQLTSAFADSIGESGPDSSNPFLAASFIYSGNPALLGMQLQGRNSAAFLTGAGPTASVELYQDELDQPGTLTFDIRTPRTPFLATQFDFFVPAPGAVALAPLASMALVATRRRRK